MKNIAAQLHSLHATLTLVLTRLDVLEAAAQVQAGSSNEVPEANNLRTETDDRREEFSAQVTTAGLPRMISNQKEKLAAIPELKVPEEWPRFISQVTLIMDAAYPWIADWLHRVHNLTDRPNESALHRIAQGICLGREENELYRQFSLDLWIVFTLKVQGESRSIISLMHTEMKYLGFMVGENRIKIDSKYR